MDGVVHPNVEQAIGRDRIRKALKRYENRPADEHRYGIVRSVNDDGSYEVLLDGDVQTSRCAQYGTALVGDRVLAVTKKDGRNDLIGRLGGEPVDPTIEERFEKLETDYIVAQGTSGIWEWRKWASGIAECFCRVNFGGLTCDSAWGSMYYTAAKNVGNYPFAFTKSPAISVELFGSRDGLAIINGYGNATQAPNVYLMRPDKVTTSFDLACSFLAVGRWK